MCAHALSVRRMPPMLHIPLKELALGATDQLLAGEPRCRMDQRHGILQLIAESVGTAGLIIATPSPEPAGYCLVNQPAVGQYVQRWIRCFHLHSTQGMVPVFPHRFQCLPRARRPAESLNELLRFVCVMGRAEYKHDFALLPFA